MIGRASGQPSPPHFLGPNAMQPYYELTFFIFGGITACALFFGW